MNNLLKSFLITSLIAIGIGAFITAMVSLSGEGFLVFWGTLVFSCVWAMVYAGTRMDDE